MVFKKISISETDAYGKGIYAAEPISKGEKILMFDGPIISFEEAIAKGRENHVLPVGLNQYVDIEEPESLVNHSCNPSAGLIRNNTLVAIKDITLGDHITFDYSTVTIDDWTMDCHCGSKNCRKKISNFRDLPQTVQDKYKKITPQWVLDNST